jgi:tetratricopeptide (TPR) repeat protein
MWMYRSKQTDPRSAALAEKADQVLRYDFPGADKQAVQLLREAVAIDRRNARAWGLLAFAVAAGSEGDPTSQTPDEMAQIEDAIRSAQRIEPNESNALLARFMVQRSLRDWIPTDTNLRSLLRLDPDNIFAIERLMGMLQAAGLNEESRRWNERQIALDPLSPGPQFRRALKFWISGHIPEADMAADQATQKWPAHPLVWNARFNIYAFTNRAGAALAMLNDEGSRPKTLSPLAVQTWRVSLEALEARTPKLIAAARDANLAAARQAPALAAYGVMILSGLGEVDAAYEIASGFLLGRGPVIVRKEDIGGNFTRSPGWRMTQWLFTPPVAALRSDGRFGSLCDGIGVSAYWRWRGVRPDYLRTPS